jgi:hypothetical protein
MSGSKKKIALVWPIFQALYPRPFQAFAELLVCAGRQADYEFAPRVFERQSLVMAMNTLGEEMLQSEHDACIVFDDDCFPPHDVIPRLLARCFDEGHAFVSTAGVMRGYPYTTTAARHFPEGMTGIFTPGDRIDRLAAFEWLDDLPQALTQVVLCGVPAAIIHRRVFEQVPRPWFGDQDSRGERMTHDVFFCDKLKTAGIPIYVDGTIRCGHLTESPIVTFDNRAQVRSLTTHVQQLAGASA